MTTFYIARHGETDNNRLQKLSGWIDTPLTSAGLQPTTRATAKLRSLRIDAVYSSDLGRAFVTAYVMTRQLGLSGEIIRLPGLREVNYGEAANMLKSEAYTRWPDLDRNTHFTPPDGESLDHMQKRVLSTLNTLSGNYTDATILIVAHSGVIAAINAGFTGNDFGHHNITDEYPHDYIARFTLENSRVNTFEEVS